MSKIKLLQLLPKFKERFFHGWGKEKLPYGRQRKRLIEGKDKSGKILPEGLVDYFTNATGTITDQLLLKHFSQEVEVSREYAYGSLAIVGKWDVVKWICIDVDHPWQIAVANEFLKPALDSYGITYMIEPSREGRHHIWFMTNITPELAEKFMFQLFTECKQKVKEWEIYPLFKRRGSIFRMPGGYHFKAERANGVIWNGQESNDPCFIMQAFLELPIYHEHDIQSRIKIIGAESTVELPKRERVAYKKFRYIPRNLPIPVEGMPEYMNCMTSNCQAIRKLVYDAVNNDFIQDPGIEHHNTLLVFAGLAKFVNYVHKDKSGSVWFEKMLEYYRDRDVASHGLDYTSDKDPHKGMWKCKTLNDYFGYCEGCPFWNRDGFDNPKQLYFGTKVKKVKVDDIQASHS